MAALRGQWPVCCACQFGVQGQMREAEAAYNASLTEAAEKLPAAVDRLMRVLCSALCRASLRVCVCVQR